MTLHRQWIAHLFYVLLLISLYFNYIHAISTSEVETLSDSCHWELLYLNSIVLRARLAAEPEIR